MRRMLSVMLITAILLGHAGLLTAQAAAEGTNADDSTGGRGEIFVATNRIKEDVFTYYVIGGEATIDACSDSAEGALLIPATLGGYPVAVIGNGAFFGCRSLTSVTIPDSVTSIGNGAFNGTP